ncbi:Lysine exporter protein (LYSE/YGGA) [Paenibacillus curdlanolyticus YK9]|uniref:Lysine exporter protein (LYSE/YGGA) n=1 Tax=Paenibacillus curdlanolyticus YK9 TaxID=717606 RepID=E0I3K3_9BACL|nr:LysE family transporter [Paenibacillus curdlanolyticus]EFM12867.1 Lysine exporter protein (LYSE/YGGA) [Paenibacillus curdlanolyticus YK9]
MTLALLAGFTLALGLILPLGVQNLYVLSNGMLQPSVSKGLPTAITASLCDTFLILLSVAGVNATFNAIPQLKTIMSIIGIVFLGYMGIKTWRQSSTASASSTSDFSVKKQIGFTISISLLNPHAIMDTLLVIGTASLHYEGGAKWMFLIACIAVSWSWFIGLLFIGRMLARLGGTARWARYANKGSAFLLWGSALYIAQNLLNN